MNEAPRSSVPESGLLNINKPGGISSFAVVARVKRVLGIKKVGHCGTLDPLAEGVLLVLFGKATKLQAELMGQKKTYRTRLKLGITTDTGDTAGAVTAQNEVPAFTDERIAAVLQKYTGDIEQVPPMYSALKYGGRKLYEIARSGQEVPRQPRKVTIYRLELLNRDAASLELRVECSRGTYIRTLGEDIGKELACGATVEYLCREQVGEYALSSALDGKLLDSMAKVELYSHVIDIMKKYQQQ